MAGGSKKKFYGVRVGRDGARVYHSWPECQAAVNGYPNSQFKGFVTSEESHAWVNEWISENSFAQWQSPVGGDTTSTISPTTQDSNINSLQDAQDVKQRGTSISLRSISPDKPPGPLIPAQSIQNFPNWYLPTAEDLADADADVDDADADVDFWNSDDTGGSDVKPVVTKKPPVPPLTLQQHQVLERALRKESFFFTGSAGTGKSLLLGEIIGALRVSSSPEQVVVTASTGIAAVNIGGTTLHSFAGIGLGKESGEKLVKKIKGNPSVRARWTDCQTLIIDEISMIDGVLFDKLEYIARQVRDKNEPFGGIQLILSGDFFQLPPVPDLHDGVQLPVTFAFDADTWGLCIKTPIVLSQVFRQKDPTFVQLLTRMRYGKLSDADAKQFDRLIRAVPCTDGFEPTELFPLRREVEAANASRLSSLPGPSHTYKALDVAGIDIRGNPITQQQAQKLLERLIATKFLTLKVGAQVMLIKNLAQGSLVNGSQGKVIAFKTVTQARHDMDEIAAVETAQGSHNKNSSRSKEGTKEIDAKSMDKISDGARVWPLVRFTNGRVLLCVPLEFSVENFRGWTEVRRDQVPLILAWALSVHKSQGQTLERVKVNLARTFEKGQAYVALSRATSMETLQVLNFDKSKVMAHPRVLEWSAKLLQKLDEDEEEAIMRDMDDEEAIKAFFDDDDDDPL